MGSQTPGQNALPVRKGFRVLAARGALTSESKLTKEEAEGPRSETRSSSFGLGVLKTQKLQGSRVRRKVEPV